MSGAWTLESGVSSREIGTFPKILLFELNRGTKAAQAGRNFCAVCEENDIEARQENGSLFGRIVLTLVTLHLQEDLQGVLLLIIINLCFRARQHLRSLAPIMNGL